MITNLTPEALDSTSTPKRCEVCKRDICKIPFCEQQRITPETALGERCSMYQFGPDCHGHSSPPPRPDELGNFKNKYGLGSLYTKQEAYHKNPYKEVYDEVMKDIEVLILSSRDQGYQEGVEDAVKEASDARHEAGQLGLDPNSTMDCVFEAISSLKDKLKPKEKSV